MSWKSFQLNLPVVPITDLAIKEDNLIAATQGRSFWLIDDLTPLHQLNDQVAKKPVHLFQPLPSYRMRGSAAKEESRTEGQNHPGGVMVHFYLKDTLAGDTVLLDFLESDGDLIKRYTSKPDKAKNENKLEVKPGMSRFVWDMKYDKAKDFEGMILWWAALNGPRALPGKYTVRLSTGGTVLDQEFEILKDPRSSASNEDLKAQFDFLLAVRDKLSKTNLTVKKIREARAQINTVKERYKATDGMEDISTMADEILGKIKIIEEALYQTKNQSNQDPLNFPIRLNNKLGHLNSLEVMGDFRPTKQAEAFRKEVMAEIDKYLSQFQAILENEIPEFNQLVRDRSLDAVLLGDD